MDELFESHWSFVQSLVPVAVGAVEKPPQLKPAFTITRRYRYRIEPTSNVTRYTLFTP